MARGYSQESSDQGGWNSPLNGSSNARTVRNFGAVSKTIHDTVHNSIRVSEFALQFLDTPQFQRLRDLKQLGSTYYVFPGASHNRFEHSVGVYHLAGCLANYIRVNQPDLGVTQRMVDLVSVAGLCHDLGHGPFSHVFDAEFVPMAIAENGETADGFEHEDMSEKMLRWLVDDNGIELESGELEFILKCIRGVEPTAKDEEFHFSSSSTDIKLGAVEYPRFIFDIVANKRNGIDVDKFDYLARDAENCGVRNTFDCSRLINNCRVVGSEICYHCKDMFTVYCLFHTRYTLFKQVYTHKAAKAVEYMLCDAMLAANRAWKNRISDARHDAAKFIALDDTLLKLIEFSSEVELKDARQKVRRIRQRRLYRYADSEILRSHMITKLRGKKGKKICSADIAEFLDSNSKLLKKDLLVHDCRIDMGRPREKHLNPMDLVNFFRFCPETNDFVKVKAHHKFTTMMPRYFQEREVRVFVRHASVIDDPHSAESASLLKEASDAFRRWLKAMEKHHPAKKGEGSPEAQSGGSPLTTNPNSRYFKASPTPRKLSVVRPVPQSGGSSGSNRRGLLPELNAAADSSRPPAHPAKRKRVDDAH